MLYLTFALLLLGSTLASPPPLSPPFSNSLLEKPTRSPLSYDNTRPPMLSPLPLSLATSPPPGSPLTLLTTPPTQSRPNSGKYSSLAALYASDAPSTNPPSNSHGGSQLNQYPGRSAGPNLPPPQGLQAPQKDRAPRNSFVPAPNNGHGGSQLNQYPGRSAGPNLLPRQGLQAPQEGLREQMPFSYLKDITSRVHPPGPPLAPPRGPPPLSSTATSTGDDYPPNHVLHGIDKIKRHTCYPPGHILHDPQQDHTCSSYPWTQGYGSKQNQPSNDRGKADGNGYPPGPH